MKPTMAVAVGVLLGTLLLPVHGTAKGILFSQQSASGPVAVDLQHGDGTALLLVRRTWLGKETLNTHFGPGWSDINWVRLTLLDPDSLMIWRGGVGWRLAHRDKETKDLFVTANDEKIRSLPEGWAMELPSGQELTFDRKGRLLSDKSALGSTRTYQYDDQNRLIALGDDPQNTLRYQYEGSRVSRVEGPEGVRAEYRYDAQGRLVAATNARNVKIEYQYDPSGRLIAASDRFGGRLTLRAKRPAVSVKALAEKAAAPEKGTAPLDPLLLLSQPTFKFDSQGRVVEKQADGSTTAYSYDQAGRVQSVIAPEGRTSYDYDRFGRIVSLNHPDGRTTRIEYNRLDLPVLITGPDGSRRRLTYDEHGRLVRSEESSRQWEQFEYDASGRLSAVRRAPSLEERYSYDGAGRVAQVAYSDGRRATYTYDQAGNVLSEFWSSGENQTWAYDAQGRVVEMVSENGLKTTYAYDAQGRLAESHDSLHGKTTYHQSESLTRSAVEREGLGQWSFETTPQGRPIAVTQPSGQKTFFQYNPRGKPLAVITPSGLSWRYRYDDADRLVGIEGPSGFTTVLSRDGAGRLAAVTRADIPWRQYRYDALGRVQFVSSATGTAEVYRYGPHGQLAEIRTPDGPVAYLADEMGTQVVLRGPGYQVQQQFHPDGSVARQLYQPAQLELRRPLDNQGRPAGIELNDLRVGYGYNDRGQLQGVRLPDGTTIQIKVDEAGRPVNLAFGDTMQLSVVYDLADRIAALQATRISGAEPIFTERYGYDSVGNLTGIESGAGEPKHMEYDGEDRLVKVAQGDRALGFGYDAAGNLWTTSSGDKVSRWVLDQLGRPTARDQLTYSWDAAGNLTTTEDLHAKIENTLDAAGRLVRRRVGPLEWRYGYLPDGDRLWQESGSGRTWYAYLPEGLAGFKDEQDVTWLLVTLPGTSWPLALCGSNGETYFAVADRLHSLRRWVDRQGAVAASADYGPFGNRQSAEGLRKLDLFAGMLRDESGLYYARQRYYDPNLARFISMDPDLGSPTLPASHNPYAYAANNPYRFRDSGGTSPAWEAAMGAIAARKAAFKPPRFPVTEIRTALHRMTDEGSSQLLSPASQNDLARIARSLDRNQRILQNPYTSQAARQRAQQALNQLADEAGQIAREFKQANMAQVARGAAVEAGSTGLRNPTLQVGPARPPNGTAAVRQATQEAAQNGTREVVEDAAGRAGREAGEALTEGVLSRWSTLLRGAGKLLPWAAVILDAINVGEKGLEVNALLNADNEELNARRTADAIRDALANKLRQLLDDPRERDRIIPRDYAGRPDDIADLIDRIHSNILNNRRPLDGILTPPGKTVPAEARQGIRAAVEAARGAITQARALEKAIANAESAAAAQDSLARTKLAEAAEAALLQEPMHKELAGLQAAANAVSVQTASLAGKTGSLAATYQTLRDAVDKAQKTGDTVCDYARRSASASEEEVSTWKADALSLINQASADLDAAQKQVDDVAQSKEQLLKSRDRLASYQVTVALLPSPSAVSDALAAAREATQTAGKLRESITQWIAEIQSLRAKALALLQPYNWDDEAASLVAQAEALGAGLAAPNPLLNPENLLTAATATAEAFLAGATNVEKSVRSVDIDQLLKSADDALAGVPGQGAAPSRAPGYRALTEALRCYDRITVLQGNRIAVPSVVGLTEEEAQARLSGAGFQKPAAIVSANESTPEGKEGAVAQQAPEAGAQVAPDYPLTLYLYPKANEVIVPGVVTLSARQARDELQRVGLTASIQVIAAQPPTKADQFTVQSQDPVNGAKVTRGQAVTVYIYPAFPEQIDLSGRWICNHKAIWTLTQNGNSVSGTVQYGDGSGTAAVAGTTDGQTVSLGWNDGNGSGSIQLTWSADHQTLNGSWIYSDGRTDEEIVTRLGQ